MERLLLLIGFGITICLLAFVSVAHFDDSSEANLATLSAIVPDDPWYQEQVIDSGKLVLVEFTATWCGYCKQMEDVLHELEKHYGDQVRVVSVDVDEHPKVASALSVQGLPTVMLVKHDKIVAFASGMMRYETLEKMILPHLKEMSRDSSLPKSESAPSEPASAPAAEPKPMAEVQG